MGKKSKILYFTVLLVNLMCFILDLTPINFPFFRISFAVTLVLIGVLLITRGFTLKIDSSMLLGFIFFSFGVLNGVSYFTKMYNALWPYYLYTTAIACLITGIYFRQNVVLKFSVLFLGFGVIIHLFVFNLLKLWLFILLMVLWFILYFTINSIIFRRRNYGQKSR